MEDSYYDDKRNESTLSKEKQKPLIAFAKLNKYFLIPFLCPIFCMLSTYFLGVIISTNVIKRVEFIASIYFELAYVSAGLFHFVSYFKSIENEEKEEYLERENTQKGIYYIYNKNTRVYSPLKIFILAILLSLLIGTSQIISLMIRGNNLFEFRLYFLFFIPIFSKILLKENIHRHHYFSLIIAITGIILLFVPVCLVVQLDDIVPNILYFIVGVAYSLFIVLIKYIIQKYYISPLKLSLVFGIYAIIITCIGFIIYSLIVYHDLSYFKDCFDFSEYDNKLIISIYFIVTFLIETTHQVFTLLAIFYFSPTLIIVTDIISPMLLWIVVTIQNANSTLEIVLNPIGYFIVLFSSLIYNELIIFNFCGLSKNTKKFVENRENEETIRINNSLETSDYMQNIDDEGSNN